MTLTWRYSTTRRAVEATSCKYVARGFLGETEARNELGREQTLGRLAGLCGRSCPGQSRPRPARPSRRPTRCRAGSVGNTDRCSLTSDATTREDPPGAAEIPRMSRQAVRDCIVPSVRVEQSIRAAARAARLHVRTWSWRSRDCASGLPVCRVVEFSNIPKAATFGKTADEALRRAQDAL